MRFCHPALFLFYELLLQNELSFPYRTCFIGCAENGLTLYSPSFPDDEFTSHVFGTSLSIGTEKPEGAIVKVDNILDTLKIVTTATRRVPSCTLIQDYSSRRLRNLIH